MQITAATKRILKPLSKYRDQVHGTGDGLHIGGSWSNDPDHPTMSHAEFVEKMVLPDLESVCARHGQEPVARQIVRLALRLYPGDNKPLCGETAAFLSCTLRGHADKDGNISANVTNPILAEKYGIEYVFGPIVELAITHQRTRVFDSVSKFYFNHACRMGEVIDNFSQADYHSYIRLSQRLLENGIYDWSTEYSPEEWGMLRPSIRLYGLDNILSPIIQAMIDIGHLPRTKHWKYRYSLLSLGMGDLLTAIAPKIRKNGAGEINKMLRPIVNAVIDMSQKGAFTKDWEDALLLSERDFFQDIPGKNLLEIHEHGIEHFVKKLRRKWEPKLVNH